MCRRSALVALSQEEMETGYVVVVNIPKVCYWGYTVHCMLLGVRACLVSVTRFHAGRSL